MRGDQPDANAFRFFNEVGIIEQLVRKRVERRLPLHPKLLHFSVLNHSMRPGGESGRPRVWQRRSR